MTSIYARSIAPAGPSNRGLSTCSFRTTTCAPNQAISAKASLFTLRPSKPRVGTLQAVTDSQTESEAELLSLRAAATKAISAAAVESDAEPSSTDNRDAGNVEGTRTGTSEDDGKDGRFQGSLKGVLLLNLGAALFGSNQVAIKSAEATCTPGLLSAVRFTTAALCFAPSTIKGLRDPEVRTAATELGVYLTGGYVAQAFGLTQTSASHGALAGTFTVIAVPMLVGLSGTKVSNITWFSAALAMFGVGLLTTDNTVPNIGDAWCIFSAVVFGMHKFRSEIITRKMPEKTKELMASQLTVLSLGSIAAAAIELKTGGQGLQHAVDMVTNLPLPNLLYMGVATTALTLWIEMEALKEVSAPLAALIYTTEPLWGAGLAYAFMGDRWGPQGWVGGAFIVAASLASQVLEGVGGNKEEQHAD